MQDNVLISSYNTEESGSCDRDYDISINNRTTSPSALQEFQKKKALAHHHSYVSSIHLNRDSIENFHWWCNHLKKSNGRPIHPRTPQVTLETCRCIQYGVESILPTIETEDGLSMHGIGRQ